MQVCFYGDDPTTRAKEDNKKLGDCRTRRGDQHGVGTSWKEWAFYADAPEGARTAVIKLRTRADTAGGTAYWDDAGFYAYKPIK